MSGTAPATWTLILINIGVYLLEQVSPNLVGLFALWPLGRTPDSGPLADDHG